MNKRMLNIKDSKRLAFKLMMKARYHMNWSFDLHAF